MVSVEPIPGQAAAIVEDSDRSLLIADYHAGFEAALRYDEGIEIQSRAPNRKRILIELLQEYTPDRLIVLGDLTHSIGEPGGAERAELEVLFADIEIPVVVAKGNHDGALEPFLENDTDLFGQTTLTASGGSRVGNLGIAHGHTWPTLDVLRADVLCIGHEHPCVRLVDDVGGSRIERVWIRGGLNADVFEFHFDRSLQSIPDLVIVPAFNELCGGTWVNESDQAYLSPILPAGLNDGSVHLLDGTRLGSLTSLVS